MRIRIFDEVKWFIQRGTRGWADCDVWSFDHYISKVISEGLELLIKTKHGINSSFFTEEEFSSNNISDERMKEIDKAQNTYYNNIIDDFKHYIEFWDGYKNSVMEKEIPGYNEYLSSLVNTEMKKDKDGSISFFDETKRDENIENKHKEVYNNLVIEYDLLKEKLSEHIKSLDAWWD